MGHSNNYHPMPKLPKNIRFVVVIFTLGLLVYIFTEKVFPYSSLLNLLSKINHPFIKETAVFFATLFTLFSVLLPVAALLLFLDYKASGKKTLGDFFKSSLQEAIVTHSSQELDFSEEPRTYSPWFFTLQIFKQ